MKITGSVTKNYTKEQIKSRGRKQSKNDVYGCLVIFVDYLKLPLLEKHYKIEEAIRKSKRPVGGKKITLLTLIQKQLKLRNCTINRAIDIAQDRENWRYFINVEKSPI